MAISKKVKTEKKDVKTEKETAVFFQNKFRKILKMPFLTEKSHDLDKQNKYVFLVDQNSNKPLIKKEVEKRYNVLVKDVNIINHKGKLRQWRNISKKMPDLKKAIVTLKDGQKIEIY